MSFLGNYTERTFPPVVSPEDARKRVADGIADNDTPAQPSAVALNLRRLRESQRYSLRDVQDATGINYCTLGTWERGQSFPPADALLKLCEFYGTTPDRIMGINAPNPPQSASATTRRGEAADPGRTAGSPQSASATTRPGITVKIQAPRGTTLSDAADALRLAADEIDNAPTAGWPSHEKPDASDLDLLTDHLQQLITGVLVHLQIEHGWNPARIAEAAGALVDSTDCLDPGYAGRIAEAIASLAANK